MVGTYWTGEVRYGPFPAASGTHDGTQVYGPPRVADHPTASFEPRTSDPRRRRPWPARPRWGSGTYRTVRSIGTVGWRARGSPGCRRTRPWPHRRWPASGSPHCGTRAAPDRWPATTGWG